MSELENMEQLGHLMKQFSSRSYTHIIRNVYPNPSKVFDEMMEIKEIMDCAEDITVNTMMIQLK